MHLAFVAQSVVRGNSKYFRTSFVTGINRTSLACRGQSVALRQTLLALGLYFRNVGWCLRYN